MYENNKQKKSQQSLLSKCQKKTRQIEGDPKF